MKRIFISIFIFLIPINTILAYSNKVIVGGENIGIEVKTDGVLVIGLYKVNNEFIAKDSNITTGDYIIKINNNDIKSISDFSKEINNDDDKEFIDVTYKRDNYIYNTKLKLEVENNEYRTGLYVKDTVNGIGTLTLIDPENNRFLALGHQILDSNSNKILDIYDGNIYNSYITGIKKSIDGIPGEKEAISNINERYGEIKGNTIKGIFGVYNEDYTNKLEMEIGKKEDVTTGEAFLRTVLTGNEVKEYRINIDRIDINNDLKNILFTITDSELLSKTGGIVQGMSGSPIIQNNKIIGAVTHVIVDDCEKGYGIFIENMLDEAEKGF